MPRYKLIVEYDGTPYSGWQWQDNAPSVQQVLEEAIEPFAGHKVRLFCAGRTDAGVHATHQVVHVDLDKHRRADVVRDATNAYLRPRPVTVLEAEEVDETFHARLSAKKRHYIYRILNRRAPPAIERSRVWHCQTPIDLEVLQKAANILIGHHDFTTFRSSDCQAKSPFKTLEQLDVSTHEQEIRIYARSRSFLHHQVRSMVGTIVLAGLGKWTLQDVEQALLAKDRTQCGAMAPPWGLYLSGVDY